MTDAFTLLSFRTDVRNLSPSIFIDGDAMDQHMGKYQAGPT